MLSDQPQNLALARSQPLETQVVAGVHHRAKMVRGSPHVQQDLTEDVLEGRIASKPHRISLSPTPDYCRRPDLQTVARTNGKRVVGVFDRASSALATAGAMTGVPGSPTPLGGLPEGTTWVSTVGASLIRSTR